MTRPFRKEYPGGWYHVMNRGACRQPIFRDDKHQQMFLDLLKEIVQTHSIEIHAYCLMGNHFHMLIHTPIGNLSRAMQQLSSIYTRRYNNLTKRDGPLFRGRFKSIIVGSDRYVLKLTRYIHLNPLRPKLEPERKVMSRQNLNIEIQICRIIAIN